MGGRVESSRQVAAFQKVNGLFFLFHHDPQIHCVVFIDIGECIAVNSPLADAVHVQPFHFITLPGMYVYGNGTTLTDQNNIFAAVGRELETCCVTGSGHCGLGKLIGVEIETQ